MVRGGAGRSRWWCVVRVAKPSGGRLPTGGHSKWTGVEPLVVYGAGGEAVRREAPPTGGHSKWAGVDLNHRRQCRRVYSPFPLATRAPTQKVDTLPARWARSENDIVRATSRSTAGPDDHGRRRRGLEQPLHHHHVEPLAELAADLPLGADLLEAEPACAARSTRRARRRCGR